MDEKLMDDWTIDKAKVLYNVAHWGGGYFDINNEGHLSAHPDRNSAHGIDLFRLVQEAQARGLRLPLLVRSTGIMRDRVRSLVTGFNKAIEQSGYQGSYTAVYPIKVNQQRH